MTFEELRDQVLAGTMGPRPEELWISGSTYLYQTTRFPGTQTRYHNRYLLLRADTYFGACSHTPDQLTADMAGTLSGRSVADALRDPHLPVQVAALDAYFGCVMPHHQHCQQVVTLPGGTPAQRARHRDACIVSLAAVTPGQKVALIGVVNPLVEAIRRAGGVCLPCDLDLAETAWGDPVERDMNVVLAQADSVICTAMTLGNGTFDRISALARARKIPLTVYAQTGSAAAARLVGRGISALLAEPFPFSQFSGEATEVFLYKE